MLVNALPRFLLFALLLAVQAASAQAFKNAWPNTNFDLTDIELGEIMSGGPPKDGIPSIDAPNFDDVAQAANWIAPLEPVIAVVVDGHARAYPLQILTWHEIVNDQIGDTPVSVTFCPLCNASIVFDRRLNGMVLDFGTTGLLRMSDLVMYDRQTESWWQQFSGAAIVGEQTGSVLTRIPSSIVSFSSFATAWPEGKVLNRDTGIARAYGINPYPGYDNINTSPFLFRGKIDDRLPPMERVLGIHVSASYKIFPFSLFDNTPLIQDRFADTDILIVDTGEVRSALDDRKISASRRLPQVTAWQRRVASDADSLDFELKNGRLRDRQSGSEWNAFGTAISGPLKGQQLQPVDSGIHFAFAWLAFNPDTVIHRIDSG